MPRKFLIIQQIAHEDAGVFGAMVSAGGFETVLAKMHAGQPVPPDPREFAGILVMGGPMNVDQTGRYPWLTGQLGLIAAAARENVPVLGICLGSQLAAAALGGRIYAGGKPEIGWYGVDLTAEAETDKLLMGFPASLDVFQWHGQTFDLPDGAVLLAGSELFPHQAFRAADCVWGIQFHLEVTEAHVRNWLDVNRDEASSAGVDAEAVIAETDLRLSRIAPLAGSLFGRFLDTCRGAQT